MPSYLVALISVALGAGGSFYTTQRIAKTQWDRQQSTRWDQRRLEAYTDYATAVKLAIIRSRSILGFMGLSPTLTPMSPAEGLPLLAVEENSRTAKLEAVMLLATPETIAAARDWHGIAWRFHQWAAGTDSATATMVETTYAEAQIAREKYYAAVRSELGISVA